MKNKLSSYFIIGSLFTMAIVLTYFLLDYFVFDMSDLNKILSGIIVGLLGITLAVVLFSAHYIVVRKKEEVKRSFDFYIENQISNSGTGVVIFNSSYDIIWASKFIEDRFSEGLIGKKLTSISKSFSNEFKKSSKRFRFESKGFIFEVLTNIEKKIVVLKDVTNEEKILKQYISEKLVIGEMEIDNFQQFQVTISEQELFQAQSLVIETLDTLSKQHNFIYRQYVNGKYIFFTNEGTLAKLIENNFDFLNNIRNMKIDTNPLSVSVGIGIGTSDQKILQQLSQEGLKQSQARGGDQITIMSKNAKPQFFGSKFEIAQAVSRVKIKQISGLLEKKLLQKEIKNVVIYGHVIADLDAVGSSLALKNIAEEFGKEVFIGNVTFDSTTEKVLEDVFEGEDTSFFVKKTKASRLTTKDTLVIIVDTSEVKRTENHDAFKKANPSNVFIFDHHRTSNLSKEIPSSNVYIDANASSASEIIVEVLTFMRKTIKLKRDIAQMLLNGIFLDTSNFTKSTSTRTYVAAAYLESQGASSAISTNILKVPEDASQYISLILNNMQEIKPGYFLAYYEGEVADDVISMAADEILRTKGRKASFVVAKSKSGKNAFKMSARGIETNVQKITEAVGGGGHFGAAAALSTEPLTIFIDNIKQAISSDKGDK